MYKPTHFIFVEPVADGNDSIDFSVLDYDSPAIFLAGPCPRTDYETDWRLSALQILDEIGFNGTVVSPTSRHYAEMADQADAHRRQTGWERIAMYRASAIVFWVPRSKEHPGLNTNVEFGEWYKKPGIFLGYPETAEHMAYLADKFAEQGKTPVHDLRHLLQSAVDHIYSNSSVTFFTSDTHFGQQRTLEMSRRPFVDVDEMDLNLVSNWNKTVGTRSTVVHAGDFADTTVDEQTYRARLETLLNLLNFGHLHWILGNYDRKVSALVQNVVTWFNTTHDDKKVTIHHQSYRMSLVDDEGKSHDYLVVHEPTLDETGHHSADEMKPGEVMLYGHIHGLCFIKRRGLNLSVDCHGFTPVLDRTIIWYSNAINSLDSNVFE